MKRHPSLIPISRQHHGGLLTARLLQHGAPPYKGMPTAAADKLAYTLQFYTDHLQAHFEIEETTVFAAARAHSEALAEQTDVLLAEHRQLEALIQALPQADAATLPDKLDEVGQLLEQHIRREEREFFELLQQSLPDEKLQLLQQLVLKHLA
ncbi:hemerythrin domain-containing protein [Pontibacter sp. E15-1]|uniref:hemerythrin domain-containing protein n=1 Tax=Pontibacter sp. E15-1 TaxID=2919918 RepID=UPI001F502E2F|nr:hemerythrin domain-containing protein [Pontibacter sp. E15-1]MCJ8165596.1 hemerythrin domain-containing protein [Pontibacter sp. E15-1]